MRIAPSVVSMNPAPMPRCIAGTVKRLCPQRLSIVLPSGIQTMTASRLSFFASNLEKAEWVGMSERVAVVLFVCLFDSYLCDAKRFFL